MTEKQKTVLDTIIAALPPEVQDPFLEVAQYAVSLGYMPVLKGARGSYADFIKGKVQRSILKIDTDPHFPPRLALRFYALSEYPPILHQAVVQRALELRPKGYEARCYGCGRCDGTQGYTFAFPEGGQGFWCGRDIISLPSFGAEHLADIKAAMKAQDDFFMGRIEK